MEKKQYFRIEIYEGCPATIPNVSRRFNSREEAKQYRIDNGIPDAAIVEVDESGKAI